jgi:DNA modification methylase
MGLRKRKFIDTVQIKVAKENILKRQQLSSNHHPTVKPTDLMRYLCRLITPPNGTVLDPFMGSGSTGKAAMYEGFKFIGIEMTDDYLPIAKARIEFAVSDNEGFLL